LETRELCDSEGKKEKDLPQGVKSLHFGRTCATLRRGSQKIELGEISLGIFWLSMEMQVCGGMCGK